MYPKRSSLNVALVHHYLVSPRGGERVLQLLCDIFPETDVHTILYNDETAREVLNENRVFSSVLQRIPFVKSRRAFLLPLFPMVTEQFDLTGYDVVISSDSVCVKGVLTAPDTLHICYCHTPMRYAWDLYFDYLKNETPWWARLFVPWVMHYLRQFDQLAAQRVDAFIANSWNTSRRIGKHYRRDSTIIHPPVDTDYFYLDADKTDEDFYFYVGELVPYKRADLLVDAFNQLGKRLIVIGDGPQYKQLKRRAKPNVQLLGKKPDEVVRDHFQRCKAFLFAGEEDFGITPLEAQACGKPAIAFRKGGALETVIEGETGLFFDEQTVESLSAAIDEFEGMDFDPSTCRENALQFSPDRCRDRLWNFLQDTYDAWLNEQTLR